MKHIGLITMILCWACFGAAAQNRPDTTLAGVTTLMHEVRTTLTGKPVAFQVRYRYADAGNPDLVLDSAMGSVEMEGDNYRFVLQNTETIRIGKYMIILFRDDKLMYLAKADTSATGTDPVAMMMMAMETAGVQQMKVEDKGTLRCLQFRFREGGAYKQVEIAIDCAARTLSSVRYLVSTTALQGPGENETAAGYDPFAIIQADFFDYQKRQPDAARFAESRYFKREGTEFIPAAAYQDYTIFLGTPNL